jgi:hypothetical protein
VQPSFYCSPEKTRPKAILGPIVDYIWSREPRSREEFQPGIVPMAPAAESRAPVGSGIFRQVPFSMITGTRSSSRARGQGRGLCASPRFKEQITDIGDSSSRPTGDDKTIPCTS